MNQNVNKILKNLLQGYQIIQVKNKIRKQIKNMIWKAKNRIQCKKNFIRA